MMKTVKVSTEFGVSRRVELHEVLPDGTPGFAVLCKAGANLKQCRRHEIPHPRAGITRNWIPQGLCGASDQPMQWWIAA